MASCRCTDISDCETKILRLSNALNSFRSIDSTVSALSQNLANLSNSYANAFNSDHIENLKTKTLEIDDDLVAVRGTVVAKINSKKGTLEELLGKLKSEDTEYHEEEARKAREAAAQKNK